MFSSGSSIGRCTIAASYCPDSSAGMSTDVLPSATMTRTCGWRADISDRRRGSSQRAVVPSIPRRTSPTTSPSRWASSAAISSTSRSTRRAAFDDPQPVVGQTAVGAVDELGAELLLQPGDVAGHVRLHREQGSGGGRERAVVGDRHEGGELADVHRRHPNRIHLSKRWSASICSSCQIDGLCVYSQTHSRSDTPPMYRSIGPTVDPPSTGSRLRDPASPSRVFPVFGFAVASCACSASSLHGRRAAEPGPPPDRSILPSLCSRPVRG